MHVGLLLPDIGEARPGELGERAEALGYDSVWSGELWGEDAFVRLSEVAARTDRVEVGTAIVNVFSRSPAALAQAAATLDRISDGRFSLGLGVSTPKAVEDLHGLAFERPVRRTHETAELVARFLSGEDAGRVDYDGEIFSVADFPALDADVPIYNAALGAANRRATGRVCDGWIPHNVPFDDVDAAFETVAEAAREAGRDPDAITVAPYVPSAVDEDAETARDAIRGHLAYYVGSGEGYRRAVARRFPEEAERIADAWRGGDRRRAADEVTDEMVGALGVAGTPEEAREQLRALGDVDAIDRLLVDIPEQADRETFEATVEALAPSEL